MRVVLAPAAARDVAEIGDYIDAENPAAAVRLVAALRHAARELQTRRVVERLAVSCDPAFDPFHFDAT